MIKATLQAFVTSITGALFSVDCLANFQRSGNLFLRLEGVETLKYRCVCQLPFGKV